MNKRVAALGAQVLGVAVVVVGVVSWWRWEPAAVLAGVALVAGGALNEAT